MHLQHRYKETQAGRLFSNAELAEVHRGSAQPAAGFGIYNPPALGLSLLSGSIRPLF